MLGGWYMNRPASKKRIQPFCETHNIDLDDYIVPQGGYKHFNDFFYRKIKSGKRTIQDGVCSPADGKILVFNSIDDSLQFFVKSQSFSLSTLLGSTDLAQKFEGGSMAIVRLAPPDYHRFHFPASGIASNTQKINGSYYSVSPLALRKSLRIFLENKREYVELKTKDYGQIGIVDVGATLTGSIIQTFSENETVSKGQEKGYFAFGGSTIVLLFQKNKVPFAPDLIQNSLNGFETTVQMGEQIASSQ